MEKIKSDGLHGSSPLIFDSKVNTSTAATNSINTNLQTINNNMDDNTEENNNEEDCSNSSIKINNNKSDAIARQIKEEHKVWTYNTIVLYDNILCHTTEWPSLTVQWMPSINLKSDGTYSQNICIGTHTSDDQPNFLIILEVSLPSGRLSSTDMRYEVRADYEGFNFGEEEEKKFNITARIPHHGEVNRAMYLPQRPTVIASRGTLGSIYIFDSTKFGPDVLSKELSVEEAPDIVLKGHQVEGWGMSWNECRTGWLTSAADDGQVCIWDVNQPQCNREVSPFYSFQAHKKPVQDVCWMKGRGEDNVVATVSDDGYLAVWDLRDDCRKGSAQNMVVSSLPLNTLSVNPLKNDIIACAGCDQEIYICDLRRVGVPVHRMSSHSDAVIRVHWSPFREGILASGSSDRFISLWDVEKVGMEQTPEDAEDGPPELIFSHGGHTAAVSDFDWNMEDTFHWTLASVSEDNALHIWKPSRVAFGDKEGINEGSSDRSDDDEFAVE